MKSIKSSGSFCRSGIEILHNIEDKETAQKMKSAVEPLVNETKYKKSKDEEEENRRSGSDKNNPDAVDF